MKMPKAVALAVAGGMLLLPPLAEGGSRSEPRASVELRQSSTLLPFSIGQVLVHFNEAFGKQPSRIDEKTFVYTDRENPDEVTIITVSDLDTGLAVVLLATGDYGVNFMREFFEASFFLRQETEQFYTFLDRGPGIRSIPLERFRVQMSVSQVGNWIVVALEFGPTEIYHPELALVSGRPGSVDPWQLSEKERQLSESRNASHEVKFIHFN